MSSPNSSSLRPAWHKGSSGGRGFQPPPTVSERGDKSRSSSWGSQERNSANKFAVLDDEDGQILGNCKADDKPTGNSRSEAFRSSFGRSSSTGNKPPGNKPSGRSLADLAARVPEGAPVPRRQPAYEGRAAGGGRFTQSRPTSDVGVGVGSIEAYKPDSKVLRFTRERLLSMRTVPKGTEDEIPADLKELEGAAVVSMTPQDPVCWDNFDGEAIWEGYRERRSSAAAKTEPVAGPRVLITESTGDPRRRNAPNSGRWARGVALPPAEEASRRKNEHADNPDELWDDPIGGATGAAADFSAFGGMIPLEDGDVGADADAFELNKMAEASKKLDEEMQRTKDSEMEDSEDEDHLVKNVDKSRPLASAGTTITSGSGNDVNVFEDFDAPSAEAAKQGRASAAQVATEDPTASSRLMKMIGVEPPKGIDGDTSGVNPWGGGNLTNENTNAGIDTIFGALGGLSLNPWGSTPAPSVDNGLDLAGRLESLAAEQKARDQQVEMEKRAQQEVEISRRRQEEEVQRRALAHRQAEEQVRHQAMQQQNAQPSQVELVLMERICSILENSWGRSDLVSILTTLHSEDSRVIPLLSNVDALRALVARSPQRVALRRDPSFAGDMAVLLLTNPQWQQQQQQNQVRQQEELRRRQMEEEARALAQSRASVQIKPDLPWFYSDPQNNIQGPFRGEEMRQWLEAGYFKGDLPISQQPSGPFHQLSSLFNDLTVAFRVDQPNVNGAQEAAERKAAEEGQRRKGQAEEERKAAEAAAQDEFEANTREAAEREKADLERRAAEAAETEKANVSNSANESSTQLKMMLGLSGGEDGASDTKESAPALPPKKPNTEKRGSKAGNKKATQKPVVDAPEPALETPSSLPKPAAAWGGVASSKPKKSISEIQQEEARAVAMMAAQTGGASRQSSSSGWANVAAGSQGWSSGIVRKAAAGAPNTAAATATNSHQAHPRNGSITQPAATTVEKTVSLSHQQRGSSTASSSAEEFGATMSPSLEKWCNEQMTKINGSDDLTLVAFCMTLNDANEIRQYLTTYLGGTSQVNSFATEFINKRGLGNKQEEWETPGSAKKGRKKKTGGR